MTNTLLRRSAAVVADVAAALGLWGLCAFLILLILGWRTPDNPWGVLAFAILYGFPLGMIVLAGLEAADIGSAGRRLTGLRLTDQRGRALGAARRIARALLKWSSVVVLAWLAVDIEGSLWLLTLPFLGYGVLNSVVCLTRSDGRSLLDLTVGSESRVVAAR